MTTKEKLETRPHCCFCNCPVDEKDFCYGCHQFVCKDCWQERAEPPIGRHTIEDHKKEEK